MISMNIIIVVITFFNYYYSDWVSRHFIIALILSVVSSIISYQVFTELLYKIVLNVDILFKLYWGNLFLQGIWYYEYIIQENVDYTQKYCGIWKIEQDLNNIYIIGYGYNDDLTEIRTRLSSVTELIKNNKYYDIVHVKNEICNPQNEFYAKSSISFVSNKKIYPIKFHSVTSIYGGSHTGEKHLDTFYKINCVNSEDEAIRIIKKFKFKNIKNFT